MSEYIFRYVSKNENGLRLDQVLSSITDVVSRAQAQRFLKSGFVLLNGQQVLSPSRKVSAGQEIKLSIPPIKSASILPEKGDLEIIFEDSHLIVVNKKAGIVVHPSVGHKTGTLVNYLMHHCKDFSGIGEVLRPGIVHRIDKDTSGLIVVAKTNVAHMDLSAQFKNHSVKRQYQALVWGVPKNEFGKIDAALGRHPIRRKEIAILTNDSKAQGKRVKKGKNAITHWRVLQRYDFFSLLACRLETGRTHQIRVHLNSIGHPLVGDQQYGKTPKKIFSLLPIELKRSISKFSRQALHAEILGFKHPFSGEWYEFVSKIPKDFNLLLSQIQKLKSNL